MLKSCFGFPLRTGTGIIAIVNAILSFCYIVFNIWQHYLFRKLLITQDKNILSSDGSRSEIHYYMHSLSEAEHDVMINAVTSTFLLAGFIMFFANCDLKYATIKNATQKIYLWLMVNYVQFIAIIIMEIVVLIRYFNEVNGFILIGFFFLFVLFDAILTYQQLVVHSFYEEEKLTEQYNYNQFISKLPPTQIEDDNKETEELQRVELDY